MAETKNKVIDRTMSEEDERLLQRVFEKMVERIANVRVQNLISKYIKDFHDAEDSVNDRAWIKRWYGAGRQSVEGVGRFLDSFHREYEAVASGRRDETMARLIGMDYPFLTEEERLFVVSFLQSEGRYPVLFIANSYLQHSKTKHIEIFAKANGIVALKKEGRRKRKEKRGTRHEGTRHQRFEDIGAEYGITRERVRQVSVKDITKEADAGETWNADRWQPLSAKWSLSPRPFKKEERGERSEVLVLTEPIVHWKELQQKERLEGLDFQAALAIIRQMLPLNIVALWADGRRANSTRRVITNEVPDVVFAYDSSLEIFYFEEALAVVGHEVSLQRISDIRMSLSGLVSQHFRREERGERKEESGETLAVIDVLREVLPLFPDVETEADDIIFRANRINYPDEIYHILQQKDEAMGIDAIYEEFRLRHPDDHHTDSSFIRSYMLRDERFEAVGSKSIYQLREWKRFAGGLGDMAVLLLENRDEPLKAETLCKMMMEQRSATTLKSCNTSIYIAVSNHRLMFYMIPSEERSARGKARDEGQEVSRHYVGLFDSQYPKRFWPSPITVEGTVRSMRRFLEENGRWPFASGKSGIETTLYYALRKYTQKRCVTADELLRYQQGMADINPDEYPSNERELQFLNRCQELIDSKDEKLNIKNSLDNEKLLAWYKSLRSHSERLSGFRKYHFLRMKKVVEGSLPGKATEPSGKLFDLKVQSGEAERKVEG